jgi:hypothetical protein
MGTDQLATSATRQRRRIILPGIRQPSIRNRPRDVTEKYLKIDVINLTIYMSLIPDVSKKNKNALAGDTFVPTSL